MKQKLIIIITVPVLLLIFSACNKKLDIIPTQTLSSGAAVKTESDIEGILNGAYDGIQSTSSYGGDIQMMGDIWANRFYLRFRGTFNGLLQLASITSTSNVLLVDNGWATSLWGNAYRTINTCNIILENLSLVTSSTTTKDNIEGQALFIRGSLYFELVRLYGKAWGDGDNNTNLAVPLILTSTPFEVDKLTDANYPSRATVAQVYAQAKADLQRAATLMGSNLSSRASKWAAMAQLSRIALMQGDYATARDMADAVIQSAQYSMAVQFNDLWFNFINFGGVAPKEYVFYIRITTQDGTNGLNTYYGQTVGSIPGTAGRGDLDVQLNWVNLHEVGDVRRTYIQSGSSGRRLTRKHLDRFGHVPVIRLAEMYLTRAEANFRLGTNVGNPPVNDVNIIRNRVGLGSLGSVTLDDILKERRLELAWEGHFLHDNKRLRLSMPGSNPSLNAVPWNSPRLIMPIPQREMDVNKNLVQNEGY